jgi:hypothetical protein
MAFRPVSSYANSCNSSTQLYRYLRQVQACHQIIIRARADVVLK